MVRTNRDTYQVKSSRKCKLSPLKFWDKTFEGQPERESNSTQGKEKNQECVSPIVQSHESRGQNKDSMRMIDSVWAKFSERFIKLL